MLVHQLFIWLYMGQNVFYLCIRHILANFLLPIKSANPSIKETLSKYVKWFYAYV